MSKVYVIQGCDSYDDTRILGVCSSEEKAILAKRAFERRNEFMGGVFYMSFEIDQAIEEIVEDLQYEVKNYTEAKELLEEFNKTNES
jgi:hypothetical protein